MMSPPVILQGAARIMKRFFAALCVLVALMVAAVLLLPYLVPQAYVQRQLAGLLARETGLQLQDARRLSLAVFPQLGIAVEGVSARLPNSFSNAPMIRADRIFTALRASSLFGKRLQVSKVTIENPSVLFHVDASGRSNWDLTGLAPNETPIRLAALGDGLQIVQSAAALIEPAREPRTLPSIDIDIINGSLSYHDEVRRRTIEIEDCDLSLRSGGRSGPVTLEGGLKFQGQPLSLSATATPSNGQGDRSAPLRLDIRSDAMVASLGGVLSWRGRPQFSGTATLDVKSGEALSRWTGGNPGTLARFDGAALTGRLEVSGQELILADGKVTAAGAEGGLSIFADFDGNVRAAIDNLALHGGQAHGKLTLDKRQKDAVLAGSFEMTNVDSLALTQGLSGFDWLAGRADASMEIAGGGKTAEDLAATLTGRARLSLVNGAIEGLDLPLIVAKAKQGEIGNWRREAGRRTQFDRFDANFTIVNGIAETKDLSLSGPNIAVTGEGKTDIARQRLDYRLKTKVTARNEPPAATAPPATPPDDDASLTMPLIIKGNWDKPEIRPDVENALKDAEGLAGTAKLFGKSVEKYTDGKIKAEEFGKAIDKLFGKKKKPKDGG
jgi:uncharacterized protein involved in outer membrane biogenesis